MKKYFIFILLVWLNAPSYCQQIIPRLGLTLSKTNTTEEAPIEQKFNTGVVFGGGIEFKVTPSFSIQPELNFVQKGFRVKYNESDQGLSLLVDNKTRINYLEIPLFAKVYFGNASTKFFILGGPAIGIGVGGKAKTKVETDLFGTDISVTVTSKVKFGDPPTSYNPEEDTEIYLDNRIDAGLQIGFGAIINQKFIVEARYNHGLTPLMDEDKDSKHRVIQISAGVPFSVIKATLTKK